MKKVASERSRCNVGIFNILRTQRIQRLMTEMGMAQPAPEVSAEPEAQVQEG